MIEFVPLSSKYLKLILDWRTKPEITKYMASDIEYDINNQKKWFNKINKEKNSIYWIIKYKSVPIGLNALTHIDWVHGNCFGDYYIGESKYRALLGSYIPYITLNYMFTETKLNKSIANILVNNEKVIKLYQNIGYRKIGILKGHIFKNGNRHDMVYLEFLKKDWRKNKIFFSKYKGKILKSN